MFKLSGLSYVTSRKLEKRIKIELAGSEGVIENDRINTIWEKCVGNIFAQHWMDQRIIKSSRKQFEDVTSESNLSVKFEILLRINWKQNKDWLTAFRSIRGEKESSTKII
ncbi:Protein CBG27888 [Caenorhabditis briggsae]|uniref:Protein CBG27888 n=1 Tax=Caenorhabditis briggsae TaxID=6238 RepID=B6IEI3_CAEBR|nr:Protein CBG27888 [Caenorhabditis briggsae]CAR98313.1 Protein CBG27888 [Caenorhabditis briggsae]